MSKISRIPIIFSALILIGSFFFPIWEISLLAPQFPIPLQLFIWVNKIGGVDENVLQNINILNHYIGMQKIVPESIPELKIMPFVIAGISLLGLIVAIVNKRWMLLVWILLFIGIGIVGIYDFYLWEYDYGHNLDPRAAIKIAGMAYQPPLFGSKMLLNFTATSYPSTGAIFLIISLGTGIITYFYNLLSARKKKKLNA